MSYAMQPGADPLVEGLAETQAFLLQTMRAQPRSSDRAIIQWIALRAALPMAARPLLHVQTASPNRIRIALYNTIGGLASVIGALGGTQAQLMAVIDSIDGKGASGSVASSLGAQAQVSRIEHRFEQTLPGGYVVGEQVYYTGASHIFECGDRAMHGKQGEVMGPATQVASHRVRGLLVLFPHNKGPTNCDLSQVRRHRAAAAHRQLPAAPATPPPSPPHYCVWAHR